MHDSFWDDFSCFRSVCIVVIFIPLFGTWVETIQVQEAVCSDSCQRGCPVC